MKNYLLIVALAYSSLCFPQVGRQAGVLAQMEQVAPAGPDTVWTNVNLRRFGNAVVDAAWNDVNYDARNAGLAATLVDQNGDGSYELYVDTATNAAFTSEGSQYDYVEWPLNNGDRGWTNGSSSARWQIRISGLTAGETYVFNFFSIQSSDVRSNLLEFTVNGVVYEYSGIHLNTTKLLRVITTASASGDVAIGIRSIDPGLAHYSPLMAFRFALMPQ